MATDICQGAGKVDKTTNKQTKGRGPTPSNKMEAVWFKSSKIKTNPKPAQTILGALQKKKKNSRRFSHQTIMEVNEAHCAE